MLNLKLNRFGALVCVLLFGCGEASEPAAIATQSLTLKGDIPQSERTDILTNEPHSSESLSGGGVSDGMDAGYARADLVTFPRAETVIETRNCTPGTDPILHVLRQMGGEYEEMAVDDDSGTGGNALVRLLTLSPTHVRVLVHAKEGERSGSCDVYRNGTLALSGLPTGGYGVDLEDLREGERLEVVRLPTSPGGGDRALALINGDDFRIQRFVVGGGTDDLPALTIRAQDRGSWKALILGPPGPVRLIRNDVSVADHDGDGLGNELEAAVGTCSQRSGTSRGFQCGWAADAADTDGDGLSDFWEVLGRRDMLPHQNLPAFGANPRHKDLFVEVDFGQATSEESDSLMPVETAHGLADIFGARVGGVDGTRAERIAQTLRNPDGEPGVSVHFDTGFDPVPGDEGLYGNWGGHNVVPPRIEDGEEKREDDWVARNNHMAQTRRGIFYYLLGYEYDTGGQCPMRYPTCTVAMNDPVLMAHEMGHNLGIGHSGVQGGHASDPNCMPHYLSLMNYAYMDAHYFGHDLGYGDVVSPRIIDNHRLLERENPFLSDDNMDLLLRKFEYNVDLEYKWVDWNRDGVFQTEPVVAYANYLPGPTGCEWTRANRSLATDDAQGSPALVRWSAALVYLFHVSRAGTLRYAYANPPLRGEGPWTWQRPKLNDWGGDVTALDAVALDTSEGRVLLVVTLGPDGAFFERRFALRGGELVELTKTPIALGGTRGIGEISLAKLPDGAVMLVFKSRDFQAYTRIRSMHGVWQSDVLATSSRSGAPLPPMTAAASPALANVSLPLGSFLLSALPRSALPLGGPDTVEEFVPGLYLAMSKKRSATDDVGELVFFQYQADSAKWRAVPVYEWYGPKNIIGKPAMAFVPGDGSSRVARFYLHYRTPDGMQRAFSYARKTDWGTPHYVGMDGFFDNKWTQSIGHTVLYEHGYDTNLTVANVLEDGTVEFRPQADGLAPIKMRQLNDWEAVGSQLCLSAVDFSEGRNRVECHPWKWHDGLYGGELRARSQADLCVRKEYDVEGYDSNSLFLAACDQGDSRVKQWYYDRDTGYIHDAHDQGMCWHKQRSDHAAGQSIHLWDCSEGEPDQKRWEYSETTGQIKNLADLRFCIEGEGTSPGLVLNRCSEGNGAQTWSF